MNVFLFHFQAKFPTLLDRIRCIAAAVPEGEHKSRSWESF